MNKAWIINRDDSQTNADDFIQPEKSAYDAFIDSLSEPDRKLVKANKVNIGFDKDGFYLVGAV